MTFAIIKKTLFKFGNSLFIHFGTQVRSFRLFFITITIRKPGSADSIIANIVIYGPAKPSLQHRFLVIKCKAIV